MDSIAPLLPRRLAVPLWFVQPGLCRNWSNTSKTGFLRTRFILYLIPIPSVLSADQLADDYYILITTVRIFTKCYTMNSDMFTALKLIEMTNVALQL